MTGSRRLSQAISEGDGISVIVDVDGPSAARAADDAGAEALIVDTEGLPEVRGATELPLIWRAGAHEPARDGAAAGADACLLDVADAGDDGSRTRDAYATAIDEGLECVVVVASGEELEAVLDLVDPEILLLSPAGDDDGTPLERVLDLLADVPAGKLAIAQLRGARRDDVVELERAGIDGVIVGVGNVAELVGAAPPEV